MKCLCIQSAANGKILIKGKYYEVDLDNIVLSKIGVRCYAVSGTENGAELIKEDSLLKYFDAIEIWI